MSYYEGIICSWCGNEVCQSCGSCHEEHGENEEERPKTIKELRKKLAVKTAPNHGLVELYRRNS